jgi:endonuclease G
MSRPKNDIETWLRVKDAVFRMSKRYHGVTGVDYGYINRKGKTLKSSAIRFHVATKQLEEEINPSQIFPKTLFGLPVDVVQACYSIEGSTQVENNPIQPGLSIGNATRGTTGTLGLIVRDLHSGQPAILSNWHVLYGSRRANTHDNITQPGPLHAGNRPPRIVGCPIRMLPLSHGIDAAIALINPEIDIDDDIFGMPLVIKGIGDIVQGAKIAKYGAVTHITHGIVDGVVGPFQIDYSFTGDGMRSMDGIRISLDDSCGEAVISRKGDSGSVWFDSEGRAVALHFSGEVGTGPTGRYSLAHPIRQVFTLLEIGPL